jgi:hypothetical protein
LIEAVQNTYQGPLGLLSNTNVSTPSAISIIWDFIMYNVSSLWGSTSIVDFLIYSFNVVVLKVKMILMEQKSGIGQIYGGIQQWEMQLEILNIH